MVSELFRFCTACNSFKRFPVEVFNDGITPFFLDTCLVDCCFDVIRDAALYFVRDILVCHIVDGRFGNTSVGRSSWLLCSSHSCLANLSALSLYLCLVVPSDFFLLILSVCPLSHVIVNFYC